MKKLFLLLIALSLAGTAACGRRSENEGAVRRALDRYLASRPNLNMHGMYMEVTGIRIREDRADADVVFHAKSDAKAVLSMHYALRRRGGEWEVEPQLGAHGGMMPPAQSGGPGDLPSGHPPVGSSPPAPELPRGHPQVKSP